MTNKMTREELQEKFKNSSIYSYFERFSVDIDGIADWWLNQLFPAEEEVPEKIPKPPSISMSSTTIEGNLSEVEEKVNEIIEYLKANKEK